MTRWTYDEWASDDGRIIPIAAIYLAGEDDAREVRTLDLAGARVRLDVDAEGNIISMEIMGPAVFVDLKHLGEWLMEPDTELKAVADELTELGEELEADGG